MHRKQHPEAAVGFYSLPGPLHLPLPPRWPRSPPFPWWRAGQAADRTVPAGPTARRSSARMPLRAPGLLQPSAAAALLSSPAASLCRSRRVPSEPEPGKTEFSGSQGCFPALEKQPVEALLLLRVSSPPPQVVAAGLEPLLLQTWLMSSCVRLRLGLTRWLYWFVLEKSLPRKLLPEHEPRSSRLASSNKRLTPKRQTDGPILKISQRISQ